ncbi:hypothetical protein RI129_010726 [Pyrocoelia pectoralis]|uniref:Cytochrome P450 n=1 Tax=Pyrocoelia pectoralis TaxID=417401 RepID=A0AAN7UZC9_9COLE
MGRRKKNCFGSVDLKHFGNYLQYLLLCRNVQDVKIAESIFFCKNRTKNCGIIELKEKTQKIFKYLASLRKKQLICPSFFDFLNASISFLIFHFGTSIFLVKNKKYIKKTKHYTDDDNVTPHTTGSDANIEENYHKEDLIRRISLRVTIDSTLSFIPYVTNAYQGVTQTAEKLQRIILNCVGRWQPRSAKESLHSSRFRIFLAHLFISNLIISESLRKYPPAPTITRLCTKSYKIPNSKVVMNKGTYVFIPIYAIHRDTEYYANPDKFDPDRFSKESINNRPPLAFLPFGDGPRKCIGYKLGIVQVKVALVVLLNHLKFFLHPDVSIPLQLSPTLSLNTLSPLKLIVEKLEE